MRGMIVAHGYVGPSGFWGAWSFDPAVLATLLVTAIAYSAGLTRLWAGGRGRGLSRRRAVSFYSGLAAAAIALMSPLDPLGETLFTGHMVQHLVLVLIVPPLIVYGEPVRTMSLALPLRARRALGRTGHHRVTKAMGNWPLNPALVLALHVVLLWTWHLPSLYELAVRNDFFHLLEHASFVGTSLLLWHLVIAGPRRRRLDHGRSILLLFLNMLQSAALAAVLVFATSVLYPVHAPGAYMWGMTALEDQSLAGAIMWAPMGIFYLAAIAVLFAGWLREMDRKLPAEVSADA